MQICPYGNIMECVGFGLPHGGADPDGEPTRADQGASQVPEDMKPRTETGNADPGAGSTNAEMTRRLERRDLRNVARLFHALGHESRLVILTHLVRSECCVCDLADVTGLDQSTVSKHLALLSGTGIVEGERHGHHVYYRVIAPWVVGLLRTRPWTSEREE